MKRKLKEGYYIAMKMAAQGPFISTAAQNEMRQVLFRDREEIPNFREEKSVRTFTHKDI